MKGSITCYQAHGVHTTDQCKKASSFPTAFSLLPLLIRSIKLLFSCFMVPILKTDTTIVLQQKHMRVYDNKVKFLPAKSICKLVIFLNFCLISLVIKLYYNYSTFIFCNVKPVVLIFCTLQRRLHARTTSEK